MSRASTATISAAATASGIRPSTSCARYQPDDEPLDVKPVEDGVALAQPIEEKTGHPEGDQARELVTTVR
ncbi:MAG: hypothetical protein QM760_11300 [Nibricoccus sp.]